MVLFFGVGITLIAVGFFLIEESNYPSLYIYLYQSSTQPACQPGAACAYYIVPVYPLDFWVGLICSLIGFTSTGFGVVRARGSGGVDEQDLPPLSHTTTFTQSCPDRGLTLGRVPTLTMRTNAVGTGLAISGLLFLPAVWSYPHSS
jgi:hypothetical protein